MDTVSQGVRGPLVSARYSRVIGVQERFEDNIWKSNMAQKRTQCFGRVHHLASVDKLIDKVAAGMETVADDKFNRAPTCAETSV